MKPLEAIELLPTATYERWTALLDVLLRMLHGLTIAEHPYAYLIATEPRAHKRQA